ncbi:MAG TPA: pitrilysin family protein [Candidatus Sulfotelmatobacter sp.]|nr:pitrilysin family protein [Candidatus Sulfotelmatobacter sp.]
MTTRVSTLPNGLRVATDAMPQVDTVSLGVWVAVGTRHEPPEINGVSHMLEHMAFKGTENRSARAIAEAIEDVGGHLNAYTTREHTAYYAKVLTGDLPLAVDIVSDILQRSVFDEDELARERAVVLQEIGQAVDTPDDIVFDHFQATAFPDQPLGRPVLGKAAIVEKLTRADLLAYQRGHYGAENMIAVAAGNVDHDRFVAQIGAAFGGVLPAPGNGLDGARYRGGDYHEERDLEQVHLVLGFPGVSFYDRDYYAHTLYSMVLGGGMSSRLFQEVREKRGLVYSIYSFSATYRDGGLLGIYAGTGQDELDKVVPVICEQLGVLADTVTIEELDRARAQLRAGTLMARESTSSRAEALAQQMLVHGRPIPVAELLQKLDAVGLDDIRRLARATPQSPPTVVTLGPGGTLDPFAAIRDRLG